MLSKIIKIIFSYQTDNVDGKTNQNILACQKELCIFLNKLGIHCELDLYSLNKIKKGKNDGMHANLIAFNPKSKGSFIIFQGHIDTVPAFSTHEVVINEKEIRGRGSVDMKGSLAGTTDAFIEIYHKNYLNYSPILLITADEEANSFAGILNFIKNYKNILKKTEFVINGEPTNFEVHTGFRGIFGCTIQKKGEEGHSAYPKKGTVIEDMIPMIKAINKFIIKAKKIKDRKLGDTIGAFTVINSGHKTNQLPGNFLAGFNLRTVKCFQKYEILFNELVKRNIPNGSKIEKISINPISIEINSRYRRILTKSFSESGKKLKEGIARYFSEANILNRNGIKTIACGPGDPKLAHVNPEKEVIKIKDIKKYSELLQKIMDNLNQND
ncbi:MAG: M20/M25/M40 family metallo-hydrolase [bacterium]|nr:M20/M25/M40 family metallo-hydrolase [bacterium]